jgi:hypothetical protein
MEISDGDLAGFVDEWMLADQAEVTVEAYVARSARGAPSMPHSRPINHRFRRLRARD